MDENKTTDPVALFDQMGALLANCAVMFGQYHKSLLDNNIPIQLADKMTGDLQTMTLAKLLGPRD